MRAAARRRVTIFSIGLTIAGLTHLQRSGISTGMLHVDADNERAVKLYKSLGFTITNQQRAFVGDVN